MRALFAAFGNASVGWMVSNNSLQHELDGIQAMLDGIAESPGLHPNTSG
jgi:hypothetical protein